MKTTNAKCNVCKKTAKIWYQGKWWCSIVEDFGQFNLKGYCKNAKANDNSSS
jgi:transposase